MVTIVDNKCDKDKEFETICPVCGSKISYQSEDVIYNPAYSFIGDLECPCCGNTIFIKHGFAYEKFMKNNPH